MTKKEELTQQIAELEEILNATGANAVSAEEKEALEEGISELKKQLNAEKSVEKPEKQPKGKKGKKEKEKKEKAPKVKTEKDIKKKEWDAKMRAEYDNAVKKGEKRTYNAWLCDELGKAYKKRMKAVKAASGKRTTPIGKILADKMEGVVKSVIAYDKRTPASNLDLGELKKAVDMLAKGLDKLTEALNADLGDNFIQKFKEDLSKIIKALEKKQ